jgi:XTP/dITP diphosphohydrolase
MFDQTRISLLTLDEVGIPGEAVEDGKTLLENAEKKAYYAYDKLKQKSWVMAEDTGFFINALNGEPGIKAARWAGETATTEQITEHTLKALKGARDRSARFETVVVVLTSLGKPVVFRGEVRGVILDEPVAKPQPRMPYSSIFVPDGHTKVWAQMTVAEENQVSHRGKAFREAKRFLEAFA